MTDKEFQAEMERVRGVLDNYEKPYIDALILIGKAIGYGRVMQLGQQMWAEVLDKEYGGRGGEFAIGPCVIGTVPCECKEPYKCDWCYGCGWLTKHVKELKDKAEG